MKKDLITIRDLESGDIEAIFKLTGTLKRNRSVFAGALKGKTLALVFQKPSNRTRVSFEVGMYQLGGNAVYLSPDEISLGIRESVHDVAKTLSRFVNGIVLRTFAHRNVVDLAAHASVPVINGLSDFSHPCQALADIYTVREKIKDLRGVVFAYVGDGNNVCNSLLYACAKAGISMHVAAPPGYEPAQDVIAAAQKLAHERARRITLFHDPHQAVKGADVVYTDVWTSMGQEEEGARRRKAFKDFQINSRLMASAKKNALVMHCLPAHRGEEITDEVIDGRNSIVFDQAENRLHVQKAILIMLMGNQKSGKWRVVSGEKKR